MIPSNSGSAGGACPHPPRPTRCSGPARCAWGAQLNGVRTNELRQDVQELCHFYTNKNVCPDHVCKPVTQIMPT